MRRNQRKYPRLIRKTEPWEIDPHTIGKRVFYFENWEKIRVNNFKRLFGVIRAIAEHGKKKKSTREQKKEGFILVTAGLHR